MRLTGDNRGVAMDPHFHVVIFKDFVFGIFFLRLIDVVSRVVILPVELVSV